MIRPRWMKVLRELWRFKTRTALVVLSIAIGVMAFGAIAATRVVVLREVRDAYEAINPASAILTTDPFDETLVEAARRTPGVGMAEGRRVVPARLLVGADEWIDARVIVLPDEGVRSIAIVRPEQGAWPPPRHALLIERSSLPKTFAQVGDQVDLRLAGGTTRSLPIAGLVHDLSLPPAPIAGQVFVYVSFDTLEWLGGPRTYNQLQLVVAEQQLDPAHIQAVAERVTRLIERSGRGVSVIETPPPRKHPAEDILPTMALIMGVLGVLALVLSSSLIVNTIEAILAQQVRQIGIMKAIGAPRRAITRLYFGMVLIFGGLALVLAVPLGTLGALGLSRFLAAQLNFNLAAFPMPPDVLATKVAVALLAPVAAAALPIRNAARITVREAVSSTGGPSAVRPTKRRAPPDGGRRRVGGGLRTRAAELSAWLFSRPLRLSLRNTFRRRGRLLRTLAALTFGGAVFMGVLSVRSSLFRTLEAALDARHYDIEVQFSRPYRDALVMGEVLAVPGVVAVEGGRTTPAFPVRSDGSSSEQLTLYASDPAGSALRPDLEQGRWLLAEDERAVVVSANLLVKEPELHLGGDLTLSIGGSDYTWRIVGVSREFLPAAGPAAAYVNYPAFAHALGGMGQVDSLRITTTQHDAVAHAAIARALETHLDSRNLDVRLVRSISADRALFIERFNILTGILSLMALLIGTVGGLGLMGTMSINVIERTREIGIMRAIGASDGAVRQIVIVEGLLIGLLSWGASALVSIPISLALTYQIGMVLLNLPLLYVYSFPAAALWLGLVLLLAALASLLPARSATRLTVREVLAYE